MRPCLPPARLCGSRAGADPRRGAPFSVGARLSRAPPLTSTARPAQASRDLARVFGRFWGAALRGTSGELLPPPLSCPPRKSAPSAMAGRRALNRRECCAMSPRRPLARSVEEAVSWAPAAPAPRRRAGARQLTHRRTECAGVAPPPPSAGPASSCWLRSRGRFSMASMAPHFSD